MKVELNIDASNFGDTIGKIFETLSEEDKKELAKDVMQKYLLEDYRAERLACSQEIIRNLRDRGDSSYSNNAEKYQKMTDEEVMETYEFKNRSRSIVTSKETMIKEISAEAIRHYRSTVAEMVKNDQQFTDIYEKVKETISENYADYVKESMIVFVTSMFKNNFETMMNGVYKQNNLEMCMKNVHDRLNLNYNG